MVDQEVEYVAQDDIFDVGAVEVPPADADAHRGTVEGVEKVVFDSGATAIQINLKSLDVPNLDTTMRIFPPKAFVEDIYVDKASLPSEEGNNQLFQFRSSIANKDNTATLQELQTIAKEAGRDGRSLGLSKPENFDGYVANLNSLLTGIEVVFVRRPGKGDYKTRLEVKRFYPTSVIEDPGKKFKRVRCRWSEE